MTTTAFLLLLAFAIAIHYPSRGGPARIKRRDSGIPVIDATFNGDEEYEMEVDTGSTTTLITEEMAKSLKVKPGPSTKVGIANGSSVELSTGYIDSLEVAGAKAENLRVVIIPGKGSTGLIGQDIFGDCEVVIKSEQVQFNKQEKIQ